LREDLCLFTIERGKINWGNENLEKGGRENGKGEEMDVRNIGFVL